VRTVLVTVLCKHALQSAEAPQNTDSISNTVCACTHCTALHALHCTAQAGCYLPSKHLQWTFPADETARFLHSAAQMRKRQTEATAAATAAADSTTASSSNSSTSSSSGAARSEKWAATLAEQAAQEAQFAATATAVKAWGVELASRILSNLEQQGTSCNSVIQA
jgi:hypothetical protein